MSDPALDLAAFAERVLRRPLWPHQLEAATSDRFITVIAKARRTGGTVLAEAMAMHEAFSHRACKVLVLSATEDAARRVTESINTTLGRSQLTRGAVVDGYATRIRLTNGSEIVSLPASQRQVRGYGQGVRLVILDEAGFMPQELWTAAHYTALDERASGSRILMLGTPWGGRDHFFRRAFEAGQDGDPDHAAHHWTYEVNPGLDRAYLERQRTRVSPVEYAAEVLGEWSDAVGSLFSRELLERQTADLVLPGLGELRPPARPAIGLDFGVSFDRSAAAVVYRLPVGDLNPGGDGRPRFVVVPHVWPQKTPLGQVVDDVVAMAAMPSHISPETNGVGAMPSQELSRRLRGRPGKRTWNFVFTTNATKTAAYGAILGLLEQGQLVLPRHPDLLRQLAGLKFEQGERGFTRIEADDPATHDDVADGLSLAASPYAPRRGGRLRCRLAELADPARGIPEAAVGGFEEPVVETGGGLRIYRRPPLQSAAGIAFTLPEGAKPAELAEPVNETLEGLRDSVRTAMHNHNQKEAPDA